MRSWPPVNGNIPAESRPIAAVSRLSVWRSRGTFTPTADGVRQSTSDPATGELRIRFFYATHW